MEEIIMKIKVCGNLVRDIKVHTDKSGKEYVSFILADNPYKKTKESTVNGDTVFRKVVCWNEFAELVKKEAMIGRQFTVTGHLVPVRWVKDGVVYQGEEIKASEVKAGRIPNRYNTAA